MRNSHSRRTAASIATAAAVAMSALVVSPAQAMSFDNPVADPTACTEFIYHFDGFAFDRDNMGDVIPLEKATFRATDGIGNVIYSNTVIRDLLVTNAPGTDAASVFTTPPAANPITFTVTSEAGNGLGEEESLRLYSTCSTIPGPATVTPAGFTVDFEDALTNTLAPFASEPNGFPLTFSLQTPPSSGAMTLNSDGTFAYTPDTVGAHTFVAAVTNGAGQTVALPGTITVTGSAAPAATPAAQRTLPATGTDNLTGVAATGIAAGALGLALIRSRRKAEKQASWQTRPES